MFVITLRSIVLATVALFTVALSVAAAQEAQPTVPALAEDDDAALINATLTSGELALVNGSGSITKNGINVPADRAAAILSNPSAHYFNVHTALNPDGAIRGQLSTGTVTGGIGY